MTDGPTTAILPYVLFGIESSFAAEFIDSLGRLGFAIAAGVITEPPRWSLRGTPVVLHPDEISPLLLKLPTVNCAAGPVTRQAHRKAMLERGFSHFPTLVDPSSVTPPSAYLGRGCFINAGAILGGAVEIDDFALVNRAASIGHHSVVETCAVIGPGATLASNCRVGQGAMIGAGAVLAPGVKIGAGAVVAAGAAVHRDVEAGVTVLGNPARVARQTAAEHA
jgi:sugar O-acyltransferase (sialic acid O-acetyltransferase NeuD family)